MKLYSVDNERIHLLNITLESTNVPGTNVGYVLHRVDTRLVPGTSLGQSLHPDLFQEQIWGASSIELTPKFVLGTTFGVSSMEPTLELFPEQLWCTSPSI